MAAQARSRSKNTPTTAANWGPDIGALSMESSSKVVGKLMVVGFSAMVRSALPVEHAF
jgi:hypothetical protein